MLLVIVVCLKGDGETFGSSFAVLGGSYWILVSGCLWFVGFNGGLSGVEVT